MLSIGHLSSEAPLTLSRSAYHRIPRVQNITLRRSSPSNRHYCSLSLKLALRSTDTERRTGSLKRRSAAGPKFRQMLINRTSARVSVERYDVNPQMQRQRQAITPRPNSQRVAQINDGPYNCNITKNCFYSNCADCLTWETNKTRLYAHDMTIDTNLYYTLHRIRQFFYRVLAYWRAILI